MSDIKITVGGTIEADATRRFTEAWHRAARGDSPPLIAPTITTSH